MADGTVVSVGVVFPRPYSDSSVEVMVDSDSDELDRVLAERLHALIVENPWFDGAAEFLAGHTGPPWPSPDDVGRWLDALRGVPGPVWHAETVRLPGGDQPDTDQDVTVGVLAWGEDSWDDVEVLADHDPSLLEARLAEAARDGLAERGIDGPNWPDGADARGAGAWLERLVEDQRFPVVQVRRTRLRPTPPAQAEPSVAPAARVLWDGPDSNMAQTLVGRGMAEVGRVTGPDHAGAAPDQLVEREFWVGAVWWDGHEPFDDPVFFSAETKQELERVVAGAIRAEFETRRVYDGQVGAFLDNHPGPADWDDPVGVSGWLDGLCVSTPGAAFVCQPVSARVVPGQDVVSVAAVVAGNPFDARIIADSDHDSLLRDVAGLVMERLVSPLPVSGAERFLDEWGHAPHGGEHLLGWLDAYRRDIGFPSVSIEEITIPTPVVPAQTEPVALAVSLAVAAEAEPSPPGMPVVVRAKDLWAGVVEHPDTTDGLQVWVGPDQDSVNAAVVRLVVDCLDPDSAFVASHRLDLGDPGSVKAWLDAYHNSGLPIIAEVRPVRDTTDLAGAGPVSVGAPAVGWGTDSTRADRPVVVGPGQVVIDTDRPFLWESLNQGGIPDLLASIIPDEPDPEDYPEGTPGGQAWEEALEEWMGQVLGIAADVAGLPELRERLDQLEYLRDRLARELASRPLPGEPQRCDFDAGCPALDGEYVDLAYRWAHQTWQRQFAKAALERDRRLHKLVTDTSAETQEQRLPAPTSGVEPPAGRDRVWPRPAPDAAVPVGVQAGPGARPGNRFPFTQPPSGSGGPGLGL